MKKIIIILFVGIIILSTGCGKFLDVNHDPNRLEPDQVTVDLVFPAAVENNASILGSYGLMLGEIWSQHWTSADNAPQYQGEDSYQVTSGDYNYDIGLWRGLYAGCLMDYQKVTTDALADSNWTYYLMATVMQAYTFQVLDDFFDQIPVKEALKGNVPHYDTGDSVYTELIRRINYALAQDLNAETCMKVGKDDLIFGGDMVSWIKFANTLKLKMYLREIYVNPNVINDIQKMYTDGDLFLTTDAKFDDFVDESGRDNYMYSMEFRGGNINMRASKTLLDYLIGKSDGRYKFIYKPANKAGDFLGMYQGDFRNVYSYPGNKDPDLSSPRIISTMPFYFMSAAESYFLQAEACMRLANGNDADLYKAGVLADVSRLEQTFLTVDTSLRAIDTTVIFNYANYSDATTDEDKLELIITQKWIALANIGGWETFFEHNRTGYPRESSVKPADDAFNSQYVKGQWIPSVTGALPPPNYFPRRLIYTSSEQSKNQYTPTVEPLSARVWWDVKTYTY